MPIGYKDERLGATHEKQLLEVAFLILDEIAKSLAFTMKGTKRW
jgi:hypothetical protein